MARKPHLCLDCDKPLTGTLRKKFCNNTCKTRYHREKKNVPSVYFTDGTQPNPIMSRVFYIPESELERFRVMLPPNSDGHK